MRNHSVVFLSIAALLAAAPSAWAANHFATPAGGGDCSQGAPCSIGEALALVAGGDSVYLSGGTFTGSGAGAVADVPDTCILRGGWDGTAVTPPVIDPAANVTVIDGENARRGIYVSGGEGVLVRDLTVRNGFDLYRGGGIYVDGLSLLLISVRVENCGTDSGDTTSTYGGGVYITEGSLTAVSSTFTGNGTQCSNCPAIAGGAMYLDDMDNIEIQDCLFEKNDAWSGPGIYMTTLVEDEASVSNTTFDRNGRHMSAYPSWAGYGGAIYTDNYRITITDSTFTGNFGGLEGGAIFGFRGDLVMRRSLLSGNESENSAGVHLTDFTFNLENVLFAGNKPVTAATTVGLDVHTNSSGTLSHVTVAGVSGATRGRGIFVATNSSVTSATNTILARLDTGIEVDGTGSAALDGTLWGTGGWANGTNSTVQSGGTYSAGTVNVSDDPGFADAAAGDYRLLSTSAARDAGVAPGAEVDLDRAPRDATPDIGAYEYPVKVAVTAPFLLGERVMAGAPYEIRWAAPETATKFTLKYSTNNGRTWRTLAKKVPGNSWTWTVPKRRGNAGKCRIRVTGFKDNGKVVGKARSKRFQTTVLQVLDPNADETYTGGDQGIVFWNAQGTKGRVAKVNLLYTLNGGKKWRKITPGPAPFDPMIHYWTIPSPAAQRDKCRVKVILRDRKGRKLGSAVSEGFFTIL